MTLGIIVGIVAAIVFAEPRVLILGFSLGVIVEMAAYE
jgi:hypothetical protein